MTGTVYSHNIYIREYNSNPYMYMYVDVVLKRQGGFNGNIDLHYVNISARLLGSHNSTIVLYMVASYHRPIATR